MPTIRSSLDRGLLESRTEGAAPKDELMSYQLVGGVMAHQGYDG
jgi:hypothetical protein